MSGAMTAPTRAFATRFRPPDDPTYAEAHDPMGRPGSYCKNPACRSSNIVHDWESGDLVCSDCGWVQQERVVDPGKEWRPSDEDEGGTRMGDAVSDAFNELFDQRGQIRADFRKNDKMKHLEQINRKFKEASSARDRKLIELSGPLKKFAAGMPVKLETNVVALAAELLVRIPKATRYNPALVHAGLWEATRIVGVPLTKHDFVVSLKPLCMKQLAGKGTPPDQLEALGHQTAESQLDTARARVGQVYADPEGKQFADRAKVQFKRDETKVRLDLFKRWGESLADSEGYKAGEVALEIRQALVNSQYCSGPSPEVIDAVTLYKALSWAPAPAPLEAPATQPPQKIRRTEVGQGVTLAKVADCVGASRDKAESLHAKLESTDAYATRQLVPRAMKRVQERQNQKRAEAKG